MSDFVRMGYELRAPVLIGYICATIMLVFARLDRPDNRSRLVLRGFILVSLAVLVVLRAPTFFFNAPLNPDEAEFVANAIKFRGDMNTWLSVDTGSAGPLDSFRPMWPFLFGADTTWSWTRRRGCRDSLTRPMSRFPRALVRSIGWSWAWRATLALAAASMRSV